MANQEKPKKNLVPQGARGAASRQVPNVKAIESGQSEQGERIAPRAERPAGQEAARQKEREDFRHGGIPIGSDPRE